MFILVGYDPKYNTSVQRAWNYTKDPGIKAVNQMGINFNKKISLPEQDNCLSLPLGSKYMFILLNT